MISQWFKSKVTNGSGQSKSDLSACPDHVGLNTKNKSKPVGGNKPGKKKGCNKANSNAVDGKSTTSSTITVTDILTHLGISLEEFARRDKENGLKADSQISWYHGSLSRDDAENLLLDGVTNSGHGDGHFLVRQSTRLGADGYVLSMICDGCVSHYQIQQSDLESAVFHIDDGDPIVGIECLVDHYTREADGLSCRLTTFCPCRPPPAATRKYGRNTVFHRCVREGSLGFVEELRRGGWVQDVNEKDGDGLPALHIASMTPDGDVNMVSLLLEMRADPSAIDSAGYSPLHRAAASDRGDMIRLLLGRRGDVISPQERQRMTGWVALHEAASRGNEEAVAELLALGAPHRPRTDEGETPEMLAAKRGHGRCAHLLREYVAPPARSNDSEWLWDVPLTRSDASKYLQDAGGLDGTYLIRLSHTYVLSVAFNQQVFNFEIMKADGLWYIGDGPLFDSLEHLVDHYSKIRDGLPCSLSKPLRPGDYEGYLEVVGGVEEKPSSSSSLSSSTTSSTSLSHKKSWPKDRLPIEIGKESIQLGREIGQGEFGAVFRGVWWNSDGNKIAVAVKTLHDDKLVTAGRGEFLQEASVMISLSHPCIVHLVGICSGPPLMIVQELAELGSLLDYLCDHGDDIDGDLYPWAAQIVEGMMYLEKKRFVHRDLATRNILLASLHQAKISDFGLSRSLGVNSDYYRSRAGGRWPVKWYAPESVNYGTFSHASDVWSYGVTLWEMFSFGDQPYGELAGAEVLAMIERGERLERPEGCPHTVYDIMLKCWSYDVSDRPSFNYLHGQFTGKE